MLDSLRTYSIHTAPDKPLGCIFCKENLVSCCSRAIQQSPLQHTHKTGGVTLNVAHHLLQCFVCTDSVTKMMGYSWELLQLLYPVGRVVTLTKCKMQQSLRPQRPERRKAAGWHDNEQTFREVVWSHSHSWVRFWLVRVESKRMLPPNYKSKDNIQDPLQVHKRMF